MIRSPLTNSTDVELLATFPSQYIIEKWNRIFQIDISENLKGIQSFGRYICRTTQIEFFYPNVECSGSVYEQLGRFEWYYMSDKWEHNVALQALRDVDSVLEIGCGRGEFMSRFRGSTGREPCGIELNKSAVASARAAQLNVECLNVTELCKSARKYDAVCAFQVLEHIAEVHRFIADCVELVNRGGKLIFSVPNCDGYLRNSDNVLNLPPHHQLWWSKNSFLSLEAIFPIRIKNVMFEPLAQHHENAYMNVLKHRLKKRSRLLARLLFNRAVFPIFRGGLRIFRNHLRGHTIYVEFERL